MDPTLTDADVPRDAVARLLARAGIDAPFHLERLPGGGNNRVYRLTAAAQSFLLKSYFRHPADRRDRLATEFAFVQFAWQRGVRRVPQPFASDPEHGLGLYEFVVGRRLLPGEVDEPRVRACLAFFQELNEHRHHPEARSLPAGSEACFTRADHLHCVERRLVRLEQSTPITPLDHAAARFVQDELRPRWHEVRTRFERVAAAWTGELPLERRCLSPSDFGFHNALLQPDGELRFLDFEYAGWDDPARMACDFFCQPAVPVPGAHWQLFIATLTTDADEQRRIEWLLPVYRMKWVTILLNDFLAADDERRRFARPEHDPDERKAAQLDKARAALACVDAAPG